MAWSDWQPFPDPRIKGILSAPFGAGCYELRRRSTGQLVLFGVGGHVAVRVTSLLPTPLGKGTRNNSAKRAYCEEHLADLEYRTIACDTREEAVKVEATMKSNAADYVFKT